MAVNQNSDPKDQKELNKLYEQYIQLLQKADGLNSQQARQKADLAKQQGNLNKEVERLNKELDTTLYKIGSLAQGFSETLAEIKNQNQALQAGKAIFKDLSSIASDINYNQRGITDFTEKDIKKKEQSLGKSELQLKNTISQLALANGEYNRQSLLTQLQTLKNTNAENFTASQQKLLDQLAKEKDLLEASKNALDEGLPILKQELEVSKQIFKTRESLGGIARATASTLEKFGGGLAKFLDIGEAKEAVDAFNKKLISDALESKSVLLELKKIEQDRINLINSSIPIQVEITKLTNDLRDAENAATIIAANRVRLLEIENKLRNQGILSAEEIDKLTQERDQLSANIVRVQNLANNSVDIENKLQQKHNELLSNEEKIKTGLKALDEKEAKTKQEAIKSVDTLANKFKSLSVFLGSSLGGLTKVLKDPVTLMTTLVELGLKADQQVTELGKSFGISKSAAENIRQDVAAFARSTGDTFINTDRLLKAQAELSQEMGMAVKFSNEELATFSKLTELTGLSAQEAGKLSRNAAAAGMSTANYTKGIREGAFAAMQATKTHFSQKEIMQDISKLSAGILVKFQGNPKALAEAVVEAKKLGADLATVDKIGQSLLNWESSIENELKAELMTGKQLNLERARAAALSGDQLALTREISSQVGTLADYNNMNVLAQQSLAEAFGLSRDEMSEMLMKQEAVNKYGKEAAQLNQEQIEEMKRRNMSAAEYLQYQEQQRSAQDKFKDAMLKLQDIIGNLVAGPVGQLLDALANMVGFVMKIFSFPPIRLVLDAISKMAELLSDIASTTGGQWILGLTAVALLLPKIASGFGGLLGGIKNIGTSITGMFKGGKGGFIKNIKESFTKGLTGKDKSAEVAEKGAAGADKTSEAANKAKGDDGSGFKKRMQNIAAGIKAFASPKVLFGAINLIPAGIGLLLFAPGILGVKAVEQVKDEKQFKKSMQSIAAGIKAFADPKVLVGSIMLPIAAAGLIAMIPGVIGGALLGATGGLIKSGLKALASGLRSFGMAAMNPMFWLGIAALAAFNIALIPLGYTLKLMAPAIEAFGKAIKSVFEGLATVITAVANGFATMFTALGNVDIGHLLLIGPALLGIGAGLAALGVGGAVGAIGGAVAGLFGGGPVQKLTKLAKLGEPLKKAADSLQIMSRALKEVSSSLSAIDLSKLKELDKFARNRALEGGGGGILGSITRLITAPIKAVETAITGEDKNKKGEKGKLAEGPDLTPLITAINEVKASVDKLYAKDSTINMDGKKVGTTLTQGSYKVA